MVRRKITDLKRELAKVHEDNESLIKQHQESHDKLLKLLGVFKEEYLVSEEQHQELIKLANEPRRLPMPSTTSSNFSDRYYK